MINIIWLLSIIGLITIHLFFSQINYGKNKDTLDIMGYFLIGIIAYRAKSYRDIFALIGILGIIGIICSLIIKKIKK